MTMAQDIPTMIPLNINQHPPGKPDCACGRYHGGGLGDEHKRVFGQRLRSKDGSFGGRLVRCRWGGLRSDDWFAKDGGGYQFSPCVSLAKHNEDSREENKVDNGGEENGCESINVDGRTLIKKTEIYSNVVQDASLKKAGVKKANANEDKRKKKVDVKGNLLFMVMEMHQIVGYFVDATMGKRYRGKDNSGDINCLIKDDKEQLRQTSDLRYKYAAKDTIGKLQHG
ncbi:hypothetical protein Tco_1133206 [Tanacetum coccineum]